MKNPHKLLTLLFLLVLIVACKKDEDILGSEVQPPYDLLNAKLTEAQSVSMYTQKVDSIISYDGDLKYLGSNQDPAFGRTDVGLYISPTSTMSKPDFGSDPVLTSSEMIFEVSGTDYLGDVATQLSYSVFPLDSTLKKSRYYYTNNNRLHNTNTIVAVYTGSYSLLDGKVVLRIPVDSAYATSILKNPQYLVDNDAFQAQYKGYYISSAQSNLNPYNSPGVIALFNMNSNLSGFYLRYKRSSTSAEETYKFSFTGEKAVRYNTVSYQAKQGGNYLLTSQLSGDTIKGNQNTFLKGLGCTSVKVNIPGMFSHTDSFFVSVNRAEVIFNVDNSYKPSYGKYNPPPILTLIPLDSAGRESLGGHSYNVSSLTRYDGKYDETNSRYVFDISRFVQLVFNGKRKNYGFRLVVADPDITQVLKRDVYVNRVVLFGLNTANLKPMCNLYYVKLTEAPE